MSFFMYAEDRLVQTVPQCRLGKIFSRSRGDHHGGKSSENALFSFLWRCSANLQYWQKHHRPWEQVFFPLFFLHQCFRIISRSIYIHKIRDRSVDNIKSAAVLNTLAQGNPSAENSINKTRQRIP